jgi:hypothetical protein
MALEAGDLEEALASYENAVSLEEEDALLYIDRGILYEQAGAPEAALAAYGKARELDPEDSFASELYLETQRKLERQRDQEVWEETVDSLDRIKKLLEERGPQEERDPWTSRPLTVALEGFETIGQPFERLDEERFLRRRLRDALIATEPLILVPPASETEAVLREYELAGSGLADPDLNIELEKMMRPRFSINAAVLRFDDGAELSLETRDNEPGALVANPAAATTGEVAELIPAVTGKLRDALREKYPLRGRVVSASEGVTINIGRLHGVKVGDVFEAQASDLNYRNPSPA